MRTAIYKDGLIGHHPRRHCCGEVAGIPLETICSTYGSKIPLRGIDLTSTNCSCEDFLYCRLVVMTGISSNHFNEAQDMIGGIQSKLPYTRLIVYDLGLNDQERDQLATYCNVQVRPFNFSKYPPHTKRLETYAWKPILTAETSREYEVVLYGDASMRIINAEKLPSLLLKFPYVAGRMDTHLITVMTHDSTLKYLKLNLSREMAAKIMNGTVEANFCVWFTESIKEKWLKRWLDCALHKECIAPHGSSPYGCQSLHDPSGKGSYAGCHRFDQSALNVIMYQEFGQQIWRSLAHEDFFNVVRIPTHDFNVKTSNC